jgi:hypothetical protein
MAQYEHLPICKKLWMLPSLPANKLILLRRTNHA